MAGYEKTLEFRAIKTSQLTIQKSRYIIGSKNLRGLIPMADMMKTLGQNLTRIRVEKGLDENALSILLGISETELADIENGTADVETGFIYTTAKILQVGLEDLVGSDETKNQLLDKIKNRLDTCSETELTLVFEYISGILKK